MRDMRRQVEAAPRVSATSTRPSTAMASSATVSFSTFSSGDTCNGRLRKLSLHVRLTFTYLYFPQRFPPWVHLGMHPVMTTG
jgi:hypothetical protein